MRLTTQVGGDTVTICDAFDASGDIELEIQTDCGEKEFCYLNLQEATAIRDHLTKVIGAHDDNT